METKARSRGGRPRSFDRDQAVDAAMTLFWRHGYEGVSIGDLTAAIGIAAPSLYAAFGSKAALFREALDRYATLAPADLSVFDIAERLPEAVDLLLRTGIRAVTRPDGERGCMISTGLLAAGDEHRALTQELAHRRAVFRDALAAKLSRFVAAPEAASLCRMLTAVLQGIAVQSRDGATAQELEGMIGWVLAGLPPSSGSPRRSGADVDPLHTH